MVVSPLSFWLYETVPLAGEGLGHLARHPQADASTWIDLAREHDAVFCGLLENYVHGALLQCGSDLPTV